MESFFLCGDLGKRCDVESLLFFFRKLAGIPGLEFEVAGSVEAKAYAVEFPVFGDFDVAGDVAFGIALDVDVLDNHFSLSLLFVSGLNIHTFL